MNQPSPAPARDAEVPEGGDRAPDADAASSAPPPDEPALFPRGNALRLARGGAIFAAGAVPAFLLMAHDGQLRAGVPLGFLGCAVAAVGLLDLLGLFDDPASRVAARASLRELSRPLAALALALAALALVLVLAVKGRLPVLASATLVPAAAVAVVASVFRLGVALGPFAADESGAPRPLLRRHGFWVVAAALGLYVPMAGNHSLTDPWETHYGEVAREILSRDDWISTWWAQDGWFFSKPVLNFWMQALAMAALGVGYRPDEMLAGAATGPTPRPEWAVRMPVVALAVLALYLLYKGVARVYGRRAGLLGALVLMTMPQWGLLSHQTMADMPFVAALACAMGLLLLGMHTPPDEEARAYEVQAFGKTFRLSAYHLVTGLVLLAALPQIFYLLSQNLELVLRASEPRHGFRWHLDTFTSGSRGNCGLPGNEACVPHKPVIGWFQPSIQALLWSSVLGAYLYLNAGERRAQRLWFHAAFFFAAVSTLGKGPAGLLLPVLCAVAYVAVTGKWRELLRLEILSGLLIVLAVALPWYVAMYGRHGPAFIDRLIFHDMWKRALTHVHDTNEGDDVSFRFYVWQLGYALFPWTGLSALGLVFWARRPDDADRGRGDASVFLVMWFVFAFALFTAMLTKFHHYIFPAVPPAAMLTGVVLDRMLARDGERLPLSFPRIAALGVGGALLCYGIFRLFPGALDGFRDDTGGLRAPSYPIAAVAAVGALASMAWGALPLARVRSVDDQASSAPFEDLLLGAAALCAAVVVAVIGRDLSSRPDGDILGSARLMHLFTYNYKRPWPDSLDFSGVLLGVGLGAAALTALSCVRRVRAAAVIALLGASLAFSAWLLDVYFVKTAPHWGQRETIEAYYRARTGPEEPIVGYQMNWKGENFYTGNRIPAFVSTGEKFKTWIKEQRQRGVRTFFFTTEHGRIATLKGELGNPRALETLTDRRMNNKFALVRVRFDD